MQVLGDHIPASPTRRPTGDTLSPLLFLLVMQIALDGLASTCSKYGYQTSDGAEHFLKCFADDLTIMTRNPNTCN